MKRQFGRQFVGFYAGEASFTGGTGVSCVASASSHRTRANLRIQ
jgi:hypothetical protein